MNSFLKQNYNIDKVINNGINYLLSLNNDNKWQGFPTLAGTSDVWVTGFVLAHISKLVKQKDIIKASQKFLLKSRHDIGAWSYSAIVPPDADSTAWSLMALQSFDELKDDDLQKARTFLWSHYIDSGIATYNIESGIGEFISAPSKEIIAGWTSAHPDVSIATILADINNEKVPIILKWLIEQENEGLIDSYWWRGPYYTTTLLLRVLSIQRKVLPKEHAQKIVNGLINLQLESGGFGLGITNEPDAFSTAMALEAFVHLSNIDTTKEKTLCLKALIESQQSNGSWDGGYILRIPMPNIKDPNIIDTWSLENGAGNSYVKDQNGIFATAMACYALDLYRQTESQQYNNFIAKSSTAS